MYVTADRACTMQSGETPLSPQYIAAARARSNAQDAAVINANQNWNGIVARNWKSFADLGPYVAFQLRDNSGGQGTGVLAPDLSQNLAIAPAPPVGIDLIAAGNPDGSNPEAGGDGGKPSTTGGGGNYSGGGAGAGRRPRGPGWSPRGGGVGPSGGIWGRHRGGNVGAGGSNVDGSPDGGFLWGDGSLGTGGGGSGRVLGSDDAEFLARFGFPPVQTYTGNPRPEPGSVLSLTYGGAGRSTGVGPGIYPAPTPDPRYGYCGGPGFSVDSSAAAGSSDTGPLLALAALLGLVFLAHRSDKKRGRA